MDELNFECLSLNDKIVKESLNADNLTGIKLVTSSFSPSIAKRATLTFDKSRFAFCNSFCLSSNLPLSFKDDILSSYCSVQPTSNNALNNTAINFIDTKNPLKN